MGGPVEYQRFPGETEDEFRSRVLRMDRQGIDAATANARVPVQRASAPAPPIASPGPSVSAPPGTLGVDPRALALQFNPLEELERVRAEPLPDHTDAADRFYDSEGRLLGMPEAERFRREEKARQAAAEYQKLYGDKPAPVRNWEDEFLRSRAGWEDNTRGQAALQTLVNGPDAGRQAREAALRERQDYEAQLIAAQQRDEANQPVSRAFAEAFAGSGMASPEASAQLRRGDQVGKAFTSGGYSQGLRERGQDIGLQKHQESLVARGDERDLDRKAGTENTIMRGAMGERSALANKNGALSPEQILELKAGMYAQALQLKNPEQGAAVAGGDYRNLTPEQVRKAKLIKSSVNFAVEDPQVRRQVVSNVVKEETARESKQQSAVDQFVAKVQADPEKAVKYQNEFLQSAMQLKSAMQAWHDMSDAGKEAFVQFAPVGIPAKIGEFVKHLGMENAQKITESDRVKMMAVRTLINELVRQRTGAATTESEWGRTAPELGLANGSWDPFNSPLAVTDYLKRTAGILKAHRDTYSRLLKWK